MSSSTPLSAPPRATTGGPEGLPRLLPGTFDPSLAAHVERLGHMPVDVAGLIGEVSAAGLRGRGGAGFPTAIKMEAVAARRRPVVLATGTEGEPVSAKDKTLLTSSPHLVLDGAVMAARAVGARKVTICMERSVPGVVDAVQAAIAERQGARYDGEVSIEAVMSPSRYLAGEETALVHWINGGDAKPTFSPPRPFEKGIGGRPTLVDNVETLAHIGLIGRFGSTWFRSIGTRAEPGSALVTVSGGAKRPGVWEVPYGISVSSVLKAAATDPTDVSAILVGGYFGKWVPASAIQGLCFSAESFAGAGARLGCGALAVLPIGACGLLESANIARWFADQSAGQCGPCTNGLPAIAGAMDVLVRGDKNGTAIKQLGRWLSMVKGRGACHLPDGAAQFVESSLSVFAAEIERHRRYGRCSARPVLPMSEPEGWR